MTDIKEAVDRIADLKSWAKARIAECRRQEQRFGVGKLNVRGAEMPQTTIEAWTERKTLEAVLRIVNGEP